MKKIFYLLGLFLLLIPFSVNAATWTNKAPSECGIVDTTNTYHKLSCSSVSAWGLNGWENIYSPNPTGSTSLPPKYMLWTYTGAPFLGNDWTIRGQFFTTTESGSAFFESAKPGMFVNTDYGSGIACSVEVAGYAGRSSNYFNFTCSGTSTKMVDLVIYFGGDIYANGSNTYIMLRSDWSQITTDLSNGSLVGSIDNSINESKNDIINNQNENTNSINNNIDEMKEKLDETNNLISSEEGPNLSGLENSAGWLPAGPVDSILNLPLSFFDNLSANLGGNCQPITFTLPFFNENISLPCINTIYAQIEGLTPWINTISVLISSLILFKYLLNLYRWVDDTLSFRENNWNDQDQWGGL